MKATLTSHNRRLALVIIPCVVVVLVLLALLGQRDVLLKNQVVPPSPPPSGGYTCPTCDTFFALPAATSNVLVATQNTTLCPSPSPTAAATPAILPLPTLAPTATPTSDSVPGASLLGTSAYAQGFSLIAPVECGFGSLYSRDLFSDYILKDYQEYDLIQILAPDTGTDAKKLQETLCTTHPKGVPRYPEVGPKKRIVSPCPDTPGKVGFLCQVPSDLEDFLGLKYHAFVSPSLGSLLTIGGTILPPPGPNAWAFVGGNAPTCDLPGTPQYAPPVYPVAGCGAKRKVFTPKADGIIYLWTWNQEQANLLASGGLGDAMNDLFQASVKRGKLLQTIDTNVLFPGREKVLNEIAINPGDTVSTASGADPQPAVQQKVADVLESGFARVNAEVRKAKNDLDAPDPKTGKYSEESVALWKAVCGACRPFFSKACEGI